MRNEESKPHQNHIKNAISDGNKVTTKRLQKPLIPLQNKTEEPLTTATTDEPIGDIYRDSSCDSVARVWAVVNVTKPQQNRHKKDEI